ncbi:MAG TPA: hypothetical protein VH054_06270 [Polyangiaceae bacterium]|nr:hypothetical protein [Polyangiaceae bacterium]
MRLAFVFSFLLFACSSGAPAASDAGPDAYGHKSFDAAAPEVEAGPPPVDCDAGATPSASYPAPHPAMPLATSEGGPTMAAPRFVPIVFAAEDRTSDIGAFMKSIAASTYWSSIASQYGIGTPTTIDPIVVSETPASTMTDGDIVTWITGKLDGTHADFGAADASSIYVIYYPSTTTIAASLGPSCGLWGGYHAETKVGATKVVFAVIARCNGEAMSSITAHELFEAASDPYIATAPAYLTVSDAMEQYGFGSEIGDLCESNPNIVPADVGYPVPPIWSNLASAAGHNPCQPSSGPYFRTVSERYVSMAPGETKTIDLVAFSDADTGGPWTVKLDANAAIGDKVAFTLCRTSIQNGETIPLTITRPDTAVNDTTITITSTLGSRSTYWVFDVGN